MNEEIQKMAELAPVNPVEKVSITRSMTFKKRTASAGHVWYTFSFQKHTGDFKNGVPVMQRYKGGVQITLAYEKANGVDAVKQYITDTYIK